VPGPRITLRRVSTATLVPVTPRRAPLRPSPNGPRLVRRVPPALPRAGGRRGGERRVARRPRRKPRVAPAGTQSYSVATVRCPGAMRAPPVVRAHISDHSRRLGARRSAWTSLPLRLQLLLRRSARHDVSAHPACGHPAFGHCSRERLSRGDQSSRGGGSSRGRTSTLRDDPRCERSRGPARV
jgi:hypothetical protein